MPKKKKRNENCLEGMRCNNCKSLGPFKIGAMSLVTMTDEGSEEVESPDWDNDSYCLCVECGFEGRVKEFQEGVK